MTKKYLVWFARYISAFVADTANPDVDRAATLARMVIALAREDNPRFDRERFITACGLTDAQIAGGR